MLCLKTTANGGMVPENHSSSRFVSRAPKELRRPETRSSYFLQLPPHITFGLMVQRLVIGMPALHLFPHLVRQPHVEILIELLQSFFKNDDH